ncbi:unnamed protein product [Acanthosepion pharaonis]|uniref:Uncharacterized protein n=1 Tax=Acanthosepion pharaonis TaxID=158019 RepID=A0A812CR57_ACAPH|nr:unnamed protein product [Sepia pharaonis]
MYWLLQNIANICGSSHFTEFVFSSSCLLFLVCPPPARSPFLFVCPPPALFSFVAFCSFVPTPPSLKNCPPTPGQVAFCPPPLFVRHPPGPGLAFVRLSPTLFRFCPFVPTPWARSRFLSVCPPTPLAWCFFFLLFVRLSPTPLGPVSLLSVCPPPTPGPLVSLFFRLSPPPTRPVFYFFPPFVNPLFLPGLAFVRLSTPPPARSRFCPFCQPPPPGLLSVYFFFPTDRLPYHLTLQGH